jgi:proteasome lid subunit RPN8/RPN11
MASRAFRKQLLIPARLREKMEVHVNQHVPEEACGLVAGLNNQAESVLPVANQEHSPVKFRMEPSELLNALKNIDQAGLELLAIYHSHPLGPAIPSQTDLREAYYPGVIYLIWSRQDGRWQMNGYTIGEDGFDQADVMIEPREQLD